MEYVFSFKKIMDGRGVSISVTGMLIVFMALVTITLFLLLLPRILKLVDRVYPEVEDETLNGSQEISEDTEVVAAIGYAMLNNKAKA